MCTFSCIRLSAKASEFVSPIVTAEYSKWKPGTRDEEFSVPDIVLSKEQTRNMLGDSEGFEGLRICINIKDMHQYKNC